MNANFLFLTEYSCDPLTPSKDATITYEPLGCEITYFEGCIAVSNCATSPITGDERRTCVARMDGQGGMWMGSDIVCRSDQPLPSKYYYLISIIVT